MVKFKKFMAALISGAMLFGMTAAAVPAPVVRVEAAERETASVRLMCNYGYFLPGRNIVVSAAAYDQDGRRIEDTFTLEIEGATKLWEGSDGERTEAYTYLDEEITGSYRKVQLHIGSEEPEGTEITIKAISGNNPEISDSYTAVVETEPKTPVRMELEVYAEEFEPGQPGDYIEITANTYDSNGTWIWEEDAFTWEIEGVPKWTDGMDGETQSYFEEEETAWAGLYIGTEETIGKEIVITATSKNNPSISASYTVTVWKRMVTKISLEYGGEDRIEPGSGIDICPIAYDPNGEEIEDTFTWSIKGATNLGDASEDNEEKTSLYFDEYSASLYIGTKEPVGTKITVTATSNSDPSISKSVTITVWASVTTSIELQYDDGAKYTAPGREVGISAIAYDQNHKEIDDTFKWSISGTTNLGDATEKTSFYSDDHSANLYIGTEEPVGTKITVTATSQSQEGVSASFTITVWEGVSLELNYSKGSAYLRSNGEDSFLFLEVCKKENDPKGKGSVYCYEGNDISLDLSFMKLSKNVSVYVYGDVNTDPVSYTIAAQPKKASVKFKYDPTKAFAQSFTLKDVKMEDLEYRHQNGTKWQPLSDLEEELDSLMVAGANLLVRQAGKDGEKANMPGTEIKLKISAAPKAPKVKLNYAKNTITLSKGSQVRVPGWYVFSGKQNLEGKYDLVPYYYAVKDGKENLNPSPVKLAEELVEGYVEAYNKSVDTVNKMGADAEKLTDDDKNELLNDLEGGYSLLVRTSDSKKGNSQPAFTEVKAAPVIEMVSGSAIKVAVVTENKNGKKTYGDDVTFTYDTSTPGKETLKLAASGDNLFAYSLDGKKFTKIKKSGTTVKLEKIPSSGIIIRLEGAEDKKDASKSRWASNEVTVPKN